MRLKSSSPIVVIDDDLDDHFIFKEICTRLRVKNELIFFKNGTELLTYLRVPGHNPFIILCDINMPAMNGIELRRNIEADTELKRKSIPFVFFSTAASKRMVVEAYDLTVQGFFIKQASIIETELTFKLILEYWDTCVHPNTLKNI
jgi:CheY-like chemotaxis protein